MSPASVVSRNRKGWGILSYQSRTFLPDQVGALQSSLNPFSSRGINLCKIESRPSRREDPGLFLVDFLGHAEDDDIRRH